MIAIKRKGITILSFVSPPALMAMYSESAERRFRQKIVEKNTAIGSERGTKVNVMFPINPRVNQRETSRETKRSVILKSSNVRRKLMKNTVLTRSGKINCAARYR
jgi:hypothetical protein